MAEHLGVIPCTSSSDHNLLSYVWKYIAHIRCAFQQQIIFKNTAIQKQFVRRIYSQIQILKTFDMNVKWSDGRTVHFINMQYFV